MIVMHRVRGSLRLQADGSVPHVPEVLAVQAVCRVQVQAGLRRIDLHRSALVRQPRHAPAHPALRIVVEEVIVVDATAPRLVSRECLDPRAQRLGAAEVNHLWQRQNLPRRDIVAVDAGGQGGGDLEAVIANVSGAGGVATCQIEVRVVR